MMTKHNKLLLFICMLLAVALTSGNAWAAKPAQPKVNVAAPITATPYTEFLRDGAVQNSFGGFDLPLQGSCTTDSSKTTRPACVALRIVAADSGACTTAGGSWTTNGVCNDIVNNSQFSCQSQPDRLWNAGTGICAIVMLDDDRNDVTCALHQGTWVTAGTCVGVWTMPSGASYNPPLLGTGTGPGDQCLRCHNTRTQYNSPRVRDTEDTMFMGHKNMARTYNSATHNGWGGPAFHCINAFGTSEEECYDNGGNWVPEALYPSTDTGQTFNWPAGTVNVNGADKPLYWIFGDWLSALPRAIYSDDPDTTVTPNKPKVSYSCGRCHTTGWTSDSGINYGMGNAGTSTREPERTFPGITWNGVDNAITGQVNLAGGTDSNKSSSWDEFGITCSRCHSSAINRTSTATSGFSSPTGMSSHHSNLTSPDVASGAGYCTDSRFTAQAQCDAAGGAWLTACTIAGVCSNGTSLTSGDCLTAGGTWTRYDTIPLCLGNGGTWASTGCVNDATGTLTTQATCQGAGKKWVGLSCSDATYTSQSTCETASQNWYDSRCTVQGVCNNPAYTDGVTCRANGAQWRVTTDIIRCDDAGGRWTGSKPQRGMVITALCMNCHRQETGGNPYDSTNPAGVLKVGPAHGTVSFVSHPHGNQFLNSPHGKFTGKFAEISTGLFKNNGTGQYKSHFMSDGEAANTGNGCTGCHDVHTSTVTGEKPFVEECQECHAKNLANIIHPMGGGTPLGDGSEPFEACISCHMPDGAHLFRINSSGAYSTFPTTAMTSTVNANTALDDSGYSAVWVDVDLACGQCHGGGIGQATTTGSIPAASATLTVANSAGFTVGQKIEVPGAGSLYYDDTGSGFNANFETYIAAIPNGTTITLAGKSTKAVNGVTITQNPTKNGGAYKTKATLATQAKGIHNDKPYVTFSYTTSGLTVNVNAAGSTCSGSASNCDAYAWDFGDGGAGSGITSSHTYASAGSKSIKLTVKQYGVNENSTTKTVNVYAVDAPPVVSSTFTCDSNTWTATLTDTSTDDHAISKYTVYWGDGTAWVTQYPPSATFTKTYTTSGTRTVQHKVYDTLNQVSTESMVCSAPYFQISGTVKNAAGTVNIASAKVDIKTTANVLVKTVYTNASGVYTAGSLKPGTYRVFVSKTGYTFASPAATATVGPNRVRNINAQ